MKEVKQKYLMHLPDVPRWVETRDLLLFEGSLVFENASNDGFIVWSKEDDFGSVVGNPDPDTLNRAAREVSELLTFPDNVAQVSDLLGNFDAEPATIFISSSEPQVSVDYPCRNVELADSHILDHWPPNLKDEISGVLEERVPVVAAFDGVLAVSFAYVASETESLWDISIDTIESHRRQGYASAAVVRLMSLMQRKDKTAVWGALKSNPASAGLAKRLGFCELDELWVLNRRST